MLVHVRQGKVLKAFCYLEYCLALCEWRRLGLAWSFTHIRVSLGKAEGRVFLGDSERTTCCWENKTGFSGVFFIYHQNKISSNNSLQLALLVIHHSVLNTWAHILLLPSPEGQESVLSLSETQRAPYPVTFLSINLKSQLGVSNHAACFLNKIVA